MHFSEDALIAELRNRNEAALKQLYREHYAMVVRLVVDNNGTEQEAKDVYQEAIIHFYEKLSRAEFALTCKVKTYLYAVCRKLWLKRLTVRKKVLRLDDAERVEWAEDTVGEIEIQERNFQTMDASLKKLGEPCRSILEDYYLAEQSIQQITEKYGYTNSDNTKNQKYKCLQRLKRLFFEGKN